VADRLQQEWLQQGNIKDSHEIHENIKDGHEIHENIKDRHEIQENIKDRHEISRTGMKFIKTSRTVMKISRAQGQSGTLEQSDAPSPLMSLPQLSMPSSALA